MTDPTIVAILTAIMAAIGGTFGVLLGLAIGLGLLRISRRRMKQRRKQRQDMREMAGHLEPASLRFDERSRALTQNEVKAVLRRLQAMAAAAHHKDRRRFNDGRLDDRRLDA